MAMLSMILCQMRFTQASACCLVETDKLAFIFLAKDVSILTSALDQMYLIASGIALSRAPATIPKASFVPEGSRTTVYAFAR